MELLKDRAGKSFWEGMEIPIDKLELAARKEANYFLLGDINGSYQIWIDGEKVFIR